MLKRKETFKFQEEYFQSVSSSLHFDAGIAGRTRPWMTELIARVLTILEVLSVFLLATDLPTRVWRFTPVPFRVPNPPTEAAILFREIGVWVATCGTRELELATV